ncbi:Uncharacterised protein [Vibrio cholerae]|nr:Uncharacterised protein [Vibrio cholerae]
MAITVFPATKAALIWPRKIASGKFHGLIHTNTPRPWRLTRRVDPSKLSTLNSPSTSTCLP